MSAITNELRTWAVREVIQDRRTQAGIGVLAFTLAMSFGAQVAVPVPWSPVPMTMQVLVVILAGAMLGPRLGATAMALYLAIGALGAPVFSNGGAGIPWLMGPTGGYLVATPAAAFVTGLLVKRGGAWWMSLAGLGAGVALMYVGGASQLFLITGQSFGEVLALGVLPFLFGDVTKVLIALFVVRRVRLSALRDR